jgi:hypothetical protein
MRKKRQSLVAAETQEFLEGQGLPAIHVLLAAVAAGYDPRKGPTKLQGMVKELGWHAPSPEQWKAIRIEIMENPMFAHEQVSLSDSLSAMTQLLKYCQPQLKSVEMEAVIEDNTEVARISREDRESFREFFTREFGDRVRA